MRARTRRNTVTLLMVFCILIGVAWYISVHSAVLYGCENWTCGVFRGRLFLALGPHQYQGFVFAHSGLTVTHDNSNVVHFRGELGFVLPYMCNVELLKKPNSWILWEPNGYSQTRNI